MNNRHESYLKPFFEKMNSNYKGQWCVLHSYESLPFFSTSDVDMAFSSNNLDELETLIIDIAKATEWTILQKLWYDVEKSIYYVLKNNNDNTYLALDFLIDNAGIGIHRFSTSLLTDNCDYYNNFIPIPNSEVAFSYKFVKRVVKKIPIIEDKKYLLSHYRSSDYKKIENIMENQFTTKGSQLLAKHFKNENFLLSSSEIDFLVERQNNKFKRSTKIINKLYWETLRKINRIFFPCGMIIYLPNLSEDDLNMFIKLLKERLSILFRFIKVNKSESLLFNFKGLIGSTIVINNTDKFNNKRAIISHWLPLRRESIQEINMQEIDIEQLLDIYCHKINSILLKRDRVKGKI